MSTATESTTKHSATFYALPGFLGTTFIAIASLGIGWYPLSADPLRWPIINFLETETFGIALSRSFLIVGAALLLQAWFIVGVDALSGAISRTKDMYIVLASWCAPLLFIPPMFSRDVYSYYMQGRLQLAGYSPYHAGVSEVPGWFTSGVDPLWGNAKTPYGPLFLLIERGIAELTGNSALKSVLWFRLCAVIGLIIMVACIAPLAKRHGINAVSALWLAALNPLVIFHFVAGAHNDALMVGFVLLSLLLALNQRFLLSILSASIAIAVKPVAFVVLPFIGLLWLAYLVRRYTWASRFTRATHPHEEDVREDSHYSFWSKVLVIAFTALLSVVILWLISQVAKVDPFGWLTALITPGSVRSWLAPTTMAGLLCASFFQLMGFPNHVDGILRVTHAVGEILLLIGLTYIVDTVQRRSIVRSAALAFIVLVICSPAVQPWYLLWFIPMLAITGLSRNHLRIVVAVISVFMIHDVASAAETSDTFLGVSDTVAIAIAVVILILAIALSPTERKLILGSPDDRGLRPETDEQIAKWQSMRFE